MTKYFIIKVNGDNFEAKLINNEQLGERLFNYKPPEKQTNNQKQQKSQDNRVSNQEFKELVDTIMQIMATGGGKTTMEVVKAIAKDSNLAERLVRYLTKKGMISVKEENGIRWLVMAENPSPKKVEV